jgi:hypothetical protein
VSSGEIRTFNLIFNWRGGRAVDRAGLENRKAERPREFESHPLRSPDYQALTTTKSKCITPPHNALSLICHQQMTDGCGVAGAVLHRNATAIAIWAVVKTRLTFTDANVLRSY